MKTVLCFAPLSALEPLMANPVGFQDLLLTAPPMPRRKLLCRILLHVLLGRYFGIQTYQPLRRLKTGQSQFVNSELELGFSFSTAKDFVLVGVSNCGAIGVDVEILDQDLDINAMKTLILSKTEQDSNIGRNQDQQRNYILQAFSMKEAVTKLWGLGVRADFSQVIFDRELKQAHPNLSYQDLNAFGQFISSPPGHVAALALPKAFKASEIEYCADFF